MGFGLEGATTKLGWCRGTGHWCKGNWDLVKGGRLLGPWAHLYLAELA